MTAATMSSKGQVVIPAEVRAGLGIGTGDKIEFVLVAEGRYEIVPMTHSVTALKGIVPKPAKVVSIDAMNDAIAEAGARAR